MHEASYIEMIEAYCSVGGGALDMDTIASKATWEASLTAAGGVRALTDQLERRTDATGFAVSRPPGHHALAERAMGFCIFNNVAVAAALLRSRGEKVAILDWDVHHGNGTQEMLGDDSGTLYVSLHQDNFYPFSGFVGDVDLGEAKGSTVNLPLPAGTGGDIYRRAWMELVLPVMTQFAPDWVLVSCGYDAHASDPLADMYLTAGDYGWMSARLAEAHPAHRIVVTLEGGYDLGALETSATATVLGLTGNAEDEDPGAGSPPEAVEALDTALAAASNHWSI